VAKRYRLTHRSWGQVGVNPSVETEKMGLLRLSRKLLSRKLPENSHVPCFVVNVPYSPVRVPSPNCSVALWNSSAVKNVLLPLSAVI
jgi:hypothetical protein